LSLKKFEAKNKLYTQKLQNTSFKLKSILETKSIIFMFEEVKNRGDNSSIKSSCL